MDRICDCLGYQVKLVKVDPVPKYRLYVFYCYLDDVYVGLFCSCPIGYIFYGIAPSGPCVIRGTNLICCIREYELKYLPGGDQE